ncbi:MAG: 3-hydroxybenzoate 6-monooxygenase [Pseudomonadota bacterium]
MTIENRLQIDAPVIVAGGGIGGLAAAIGLRAAGHAVVVLERASQFGEIGAGIQLAPNAFHALKALGVVERALENAVYIDRLVMMDGVSGEQVAAIPLDAPFRQRFKNPYVVIHRADLHSALLERCQGDTGIQLLSGVEVSDFSQPGEGVSVRATDGRSYRGVALIGADGIRSRIREPIVGDGGPKISGHVCYRAVLPTEEMPNALRLNAAVLWAGPRTHFIHYPLRGGKLFNIVATFHSDSRCAERHDEPGDRNELLAHFGHLPPIPRSVLERSGGWQRWVLGDRDPVSNWSRGNVTLLGDSAHPTHQYFAQGACMALEDAVCLMHEVKRTPGDFCAAFQRYQDQRITRTARIVLSSRALAKYWYHAEGVERLVRNEMLGSKSPDDFYRGLEWLYGYGRES